MLIADLHIHSRFSRATSRDCSPEQLDLWARRKGLGLVGTGDFTHPAWRAELRERLLPAEDGFYTLRPELRLEDDTAAGPPPRFVVTGEISCIYKKGGRVRKIHNLILLPGLDAADAVARRLELVGNLHSDGRPILGLDSRDLLEITLDACPDAILIPAHIWTPHFSLFGAYSGFDAIEECFGDLTPQIHALETGLSSDPPMNWRLSDLDRFVLVSHSDAHSPSRLAREATLLQIEPSYPAMARALDGRDPAGLYGTIEFFPEEGKYHYDGHRACGVCCKPGETVRAGGVCPVCGGRLTVGVLHRAEELADRFDGYVPSSARYFERLVPLPEVIAASTGQSPAGVQVDRLYRAMLRELGPELSILREASLPDIERASGRCVAEGIRRLRAGEVEIRPGFDGEFGRVSILSEAEIDQLAGQTSLFGPLVATTRRRKASLPPVPRALPAEHAAPAGPAAQTLNPAQEQAAQAVEPVVAVEAGPGTGKTHTLVSRVAHLVERCGVPPARITVVTFTNRAGRELKERLEARLGGAKAVRSITVGTFHSICQKRLARGGAHPVVLDRHDAQALAAEVLRELGLSVGVRAALEAASRSKSGLVPDSRIPPEFLTAYAERMEREQALDYDDLLLRVLEPLEAGTQKPPKSCSYLLVDEFQDVNEIQYRLVRAWSRGGKSLFVIGDPDQAIYGFRGASGRCFDRLREDEPGTRVIRLEENYRSTPEIVRCALPVLPSGGARTLRAKRPGGAPVRLLDAEDAFSEALFVVKEINRMVGGVDMLDAHSGIGRPGAQPRGFSDIAVLYRTHRQADMLEYCLQKEGIPYTATGADSDLDDPLVREALGFFRFLLQPADLRSLRACLPWMMPGGDAGALVSEYAACAPSVETLLPLARMRPEAQRLAQLLDRYAPRVLHDKPRHLIDDWMADRRAALPDGADLAPLERLVEAAILAADLPSLLQNLTLGTDGDRLRCGGRAYAPDAVQLSTLHGAKGLEFPVVFLCGAQKGLIPLAAPGREVDWDEERRLLYVGMTRAREELFLLAAGERSPFLSGLPQEAFTSGPARVRREQPGDGQLSLFAQK